MSFPSAIPAFRDNLCLGDSRVQSPGKILAHFSHPGFVLYEDPNIGKYGGIRKLQQDICSFYFQLRAAQRYNLEVELWLGTPSHRIQGRLLRVDLDRTSTNLFCQMQLPPGGGWKILANGGSLNACQRIIVADGYRLTRP
jgi:hypothetical protein